MERLVRIVSLASKEVLEMTAWRSSRDTAAKSRLAVPVIVLALVAATAAAVLSLGSPSAARAERVIKCPAVGACKTVCREHTQSGNTIDFDEGAEVTITYQDGTTARIKCVNGNWKYVTSSIVGGTALVPPGPFAPTNITCPTFRPCYSIAIVKSG